MPKFFGPIGFVTPIEDPAGSGIWVEDATEKNYRGEVIKNSRSWESAQQLNDNLNIRNSISIVADPYISNKINTIRYVKWLGTYWKVTDVEVQYPRLVLILGGVYNGQTAGTPRDSEEHPRIR